MKRLRNLYRKFLRFLRPSLEKKPRRIRVCKLCGNRIRRRHKYIFFENGVQHRDCSNPTLMDQPIEQQKGLI